MPQIRCPNCGTTINLERRKKIDYKLIFSALRKSPKTFTDLLNVTRLPRKTLSLRLMALCDSGVIVKDGGYRLNGSEFLKFGDGKMFAFEDGTIGKPSLLTRRNVLTVLMLLVIVASVASAVSAMLYRAPPSLPTTQKYVSTFKMKSQISEGTDVFAYQVAIYFNAAELDVFEVVEGDFLGKLYPAGSTMFTYAKDVGPGKLIILDTLLGDRMPVSGSGVLATITFGVKSQGTPQLPYIAFNDNLFATVLRNPKNQNTVGTLTLELEG